MRDTGTNLMIAGIIWQVITLFVFGCLVLDYFARTWLAWSTLDEEAKRALTKLSFKGFLIAVFVAYLTIFARCIYRIAEMIGGWKNSIMQDEASFIAMEGFMILISVLVLTMFHPGFCFPRLAGRAVVKTVSLGEESENELSQAQGDVEK